MLAVGIVGLPNVGKSTLFNALTQKAVPAENFPFCTIDPSTGIVSVPDPRLGTLSRLHNSKKTIPTAVEFVDIAGLVKGASEGEGLGNKFLSHIREVHAIAHVLRIFDDQNIHHVHGVADPLRDMEVIHLELILADLQVVSKRLGSLEREVKRGDKQAIFEKDTLEHARRVLEAGVLLETAKREQSEFSPEEMRVFTLLSLITAKPMLYVCNKKAGGYNIDEQNDSRWQALIEYFEKHHAHFVCVDAGVEGELRELPEDDRMTFRHEYGVENDGIDDLIREGYALLGQITFFTTGEDETRAWTITNGATAPEAGSAIHEDFKQKFIRAEVVSCEDLVHSGGYAVAREKGLVRTEGKEYLVKDGDVIEFKV
jgi:GTP-binding protein YchF